MELLAALLILCVVAGAVIIALKIDSADPDGRSVDHDRARLFRAAMEELDEIDRAFGLLPPKPVRHAAVDPQKLADFRRFRELPDAERRAMMRAAIERQHAIRSGIGVWREGDLNGVGIYEPVWRVERR